MLGVVDRQGVIRFSDWDRIKCRTFLEDLGLRCEAVGGWRKPGWLGVITYHEGKFHAAAWIAGTINDRGRRTYKEATR